MMRIYQWFLIAAILIATQLAGCGQKSPTGGGGKVSPTPTHVPAPTITNTPFPTASPGPVILSVGATLYHSTDTITISLRNQSAQAIYFPDHLTNCTVILLQHQVNGNWQNVNVCKLMTPTLLHKLEAGKDLTVRLTASTSPWPVGLYYATLRYGMTQSFGGLAKTLSSAEFQVIA
jgi:hypothetical protein